MPKAPKNQELDLEDDVVETDVDVDALNVEHDNAPAATDGMASLDMLHNMQIDRSRDDANFRRTQLPRGDWQKTDKFEFRLLTMQNDKLPGDISPNGRTIFAFWGKPEERIDTEGIAHQPTLNFRMSPDVRFHRDKPNQYDNTYKMWLKARRTFFETYKAEANTFAEVIQMCIDDSYVLTPINGDDGPIVIGIKAKRQR